MDIHSVNLSTFDLNLLLVLEALLAERHVGRAAARLKLSQPATSNALSRLRVALKDPLFVRSRAGMVPTPRALALRNPLLETLTQLRQTLGTPPTFNPLTERRTFVLAASDHAQLLVLPKLMQNLAACPGLRLQILPLPRDFPADQLEAGEVDLVLGAFDLAPGDRAPRGLQRQLLVSEKFVLVGRRNHPALQRKGKVDFSVPQLLIAPRGGIDLLERKTKQKRNVVISTPHYLVAPWVLASTDLVAAVPERIAHRFAEAFPLAVLPLPVEHSPLRIQQFWHPLRHHEPAHRWLRGELLRSATSLPDN